MFDFGIRPLIAYEIPDEALGSRRILLQPNVAIWMSKESEILRKGAHSYKYDSDALLDFMTVHWAWWIDVV